jgi:membrane protein implicated in regulation of membrane protease activity
MSTISMWWLLAGSAIGLELLTGTFYLLMLALGLAAGAIAAHAGLGTGWQCVVAATVGAGAILVWHLKQNRQQAADMSITANHNVHLDIGARVEVTAWSATGTTRVVYRGAQWDAQLDDEQRSSAVPPAGAHRIVKVEGNTLVLARTY